MLTSSDSTCSKQLGAWSYAGLCTHAPTSGGRGLGVDGVPNFNALYSGKDNEKVQLCAYLDALPRLTGPNRVGQTTSAANSEGALLPKLLIFSRYGQSRCRETIQGVFGADPRVHKDGDGRATRQSCPGCMALKGAHQMPYKICATVHPDCRLPTRSSMADVTVTSIEGEQHGGAYAKLFADGSALRR